MSCWLTGSIFFPIFFFLALFLLWPHLSDFFKTETLVGRKKDSKRILKPILLLLNFSFFFSWFKKISRFGKKICFTPISRIWRLPKMKNKFLNFVLWKILLSTFWKKYCFKIWSTVDDVDVAFHQVFEELKSTSLFSTSS